MKRQQNLEITAIGSGIVMGDTFHDLVTLNPASPVPDFCGNTSMGSSSGKTKRLARQ